MVFVFCLGSVHFCSVLSRQPSNNHYQVENARFQFLSFWNHISHLSKLNWFFIELWHVVFRTATCFVFMLVTNQTGSVVKATKIDRNLFLAFRSTSPYFVGSCWLLCVSVLEVHSEHPISSHSLLWCGALVQVIERQKFIESLAVYGLFRQHPKNMNNIWRGITPRVVEWKYSSLLFRKLKDTRLSYKWFTLIFLLFFNAVETDYTSRSVSCIVRQNRQ